MGDSSDSSIVSSIKGWFQEDPGANSQDLVILNGENGQPDNALRIAPPGGIQENGRVPGEENVVATDQEIFQFSDLLARRNGFAPLRGENPDLRNPDLVFPGDKLNLPDGRILQITPGQYIWDVARKQYRKDMARLQILDKQIHTLGAEYQKKRA